MWAMLALSLEQQDQLRDAVRRASERAEVEVAVAAVYDHLRDVIELQRPRCDASGRCCRFEDFGHRLFVTTMELATFLRGLRGQGAAASGWDGTFRWDGTGCPFQGDRLCGVHAIRPMGCRLFFCDPTSVAWQHGEYERFHGHLRRLHAELQVPYFYVEWRQALMAVGLAPRGLSAE